MQLYLKKLRHFHPNNLYFYKYSYTMYYEDRQIDNPKLIKTLNKKNCITIISLFQSQY